MTYHHWTYQQERVVREQFVERGSVWCARVLGLPTYKVRGKARKLGLGPSRVVSPRGRPFASEDARRCTRILGQRN